MYTGQRCSLWTTNLEERRDLSFIRENSWIAEFAGIQGQKSSPKLTLRIKPHFKHYSGQHSIYIFNLLF